MGKRSRKRPDGPVRTVDPDGAPPPPPRRPAPHTTARRPGQSRVDRMIERADERPKPPWHPVPLVEVCVLAGIVLLILGVINYDSSDGRFAMVLGLSLASIAGLDTAARDHFAGYRSHSTLLAALPAIITMAVLAFLTGVPAVVIAGGVVVFAAGFWLFRRAFQARTGVGFRV
jgi:lysylphosphatidylglycerol synthetase-like protein (DUF2156 family)